MDIQENGNPVTYHKQLWLPKAQQRPAYRAKTKQPSHHWVGDGLPAELDSQHKKSKGVWSKSCKVFENSVEDWDWKGIYDYLSNEGSL